MSQDASAACDTSAILHSMMKPVIVTDPAGMVQLMNPAAEILAGMDFEEAKQKPIAQLLPLVEETTGKPVDDAIQRTIHEGHIQDTDLLLATKGGRKIYLEREGVVLRNDQQTFTGVLITLQDVTQRKKMEDALRRSKEWFRALVEDAAAVPWRMDADTLRFIYVGPRITEILNYPADQWLQDGFWQEHLHPEDRTHVLKKFMLFRSSTSDQEYEYRMIDRRGQVIWIRNIISAPKQLEGGEHVLHGFLFNITEAKLLEDKLRQIQRLEMAERLATGVSNDFNNMLGVMENCVESLWFIHDADLTARSYLHQIKTAMLRAKTLTRQLQAFSSSYTARFSAVNLNKMMVDLEPLLKMKAPSGVTVQWQSSPSDLWVEGDSNQIGQLFINLFLYAMDSVGEKGRVSFHLASLEFDEETAKRLAVDARGPHAMLTVEDNGRAVDATASARLFEPYYVKEGSARRQGLELAAIYGIVRKHQGFIQYEPLPGGGTRFDVFLPQLPQVTQPEDTKAPTRESWLPPDKPMVVLLVDNEELVRQGLRRILERNGFSVLEASCGEDALRIANDYQKPIDLLITDMVMPGISAPMLCQQITASQPNMRRLIVSGLAGTDLNHETLPPDIPFLQKPFSSDELMSRIAEILPRNTPV